MRFGVNTFLWAEEFSLASLELLPRLKAAGFDGVQVPLFHPTTFPAREVRSAFAENGLECTVCSIFVDGQSLITDDAAARKVAQQHIKDVIRVAADAGATTVVGPLFCPIGYLPGRRRTDDEWKRAVEGFQAVSPTLAEYKLTLGIEPINRFETFFLNTLDDTAALVDAIGDPNMGVLLDTFHANIEEKSIGEAIRKLGRRLIHLHTCENDRGIPGSGHIEWEEILRALHAIGYEGWLTIEGFGFVGALSRAVCIWRDMAPSPELIAFEGVKFLRDMDARTRS